MKMPLLIEIERNVVIDLHLRWLQAELDRTWIRRLPKMPQCSRNVGRMIKFRTSETKGLSESDQVSRVCGSTIGIVKEKNRRELPLLAPFFARSDGLVPALEWNTSEGLLADRHDVIIEIEPNA